MEKFQTKLFEAATQGSISSLQQLLKEDPLILDRAIANPFNETPLHVAAMLGHLNFVKEIMRLKPQLVNELNLQQSSPLHLASAKGHVDVVKELLSGSNNKEVMCLARDRNGLIPLHLAAAKGRVEAVKLLLEAKPDAARLTVYGGETILHLCVKHYQLEVMKLLMETVVVEPELINSKDVDGNTVLHLAVAEKQVEATNLLVSVSVLEMNAVNHEGMTAMDVLIRSRKDVRDSEIEKSLKHGRGFGDMGTSNTTTIRGRNENNKSSSWESGLLGQNKKWLEQKKSSLMIVATLIATMAFQIGVNPPGGIWQDDELTGSGGSDPHEAGTSIYAHKYPEGFGRFYIINATSFVASLSIIMLLVSGLPIRRKFFLWILMVITWIAISAIALCYILVLIVIMPHDYQDKTFFIVISILVVVWLGLMALLLIAHTIRMIVKLVKKLCKHVKNLCKLVKNLCRKRRRSAVQGNNINATV